VTVLPFMLLMVLSSQLARHVAKVQQSGDQRRVGKMNYSAIDEKFMRMAIELPQRALAIPGAGAVGSLISASVAKSEISLC
jgi:hypothetical protein